MGSYVETWKLLGDHMNSGKRVWKLNELREMENRGWVCETVWKQHFITRETPVHTMKNSKQKYGGTVERQS